MTEMTKSPLLGVGGGGAYIDRTVDKVKFCHLPWTAFGTTWSDLPNYPLKTAHEIF